MDKLQFIQAMQDYKDLKNLTTAPFNVDDSQYKGVYPELNFHDPAHRERIAGLLAQALTANSAKVLQWILIESKTRLLAAQPDLTTELNELNSLINSIGKIG